MILTNEPATHLRSFNNLHECGHGSDKTLLIYFTFLTIDPLLILAEIKQTL